MQPNKDGQLELPERPGFAELNENGMAFFNWEKIDETCMEDEICIPEDWSDDETDTLLVVDYNCNTELGNCEESWTTNWGYNNNTQEICLLNEADCISFTSSVTSLPLKS